jgi:hypothetical protein
VEAATIINVAESIDLMTCPVLKLVIDFNGIKHISWVGDSGGRVHDNAGKDVMTRC